VSLSSAFGQKEVVKSLESILPRGWECLQGPNELDRPGRIFYTDPRGVRFEFADLSEQVRPETGELSDVVTSAKGYVTAGLLAKILKLGNLSLSGSKTYSANVSLLQRREIRTQEANVRAALRTLDPKLMESQHTYYIIRNTQVAKQMRLTVDKSIAAAFGGEAQLNKSLTLSGAATVPPAPTSKSDASAEGAASQKGDSQKGEGAASQKKEKAATAGDESKTTPAAAAKSSERASSEPGASASQTVIAFQDSRSYTIDQTFDKPRTICFLAQKFTLKSVGGGVGGSVKDAQLTRDFWNPSSKK
jgi:hypothetical protein